MDKLGHVNSFKELIVYQKSYQLAMDIFKMTKTFPRDERFSLTDQVRRASRSIGAQIAEAWAKRRYEKHFISKLVDADGEQLETQHWIGLAFACGYLDQMQMDSLCGQGEEIGRMLNSMMEKSSRFCSVRKPG